jgi:hypothetical protein
MTFTVTWTPAAESELANLWVMAADRPMVTLACDHIDAVLRINPYAQSQQYSGNKRVMNVGPLWVAYSVSDADCLVNVWSVWRTDPQDGSNNGQDHD